MVKPNPYGPISEKETRHWREAVLQNQRDMLYNMNVMLGLMHTLVDHFTRASHFDVRVDSEPLTGPITMSTPKGGLMADQFVILPNSRAVAHIVPLSDAGMPTALDGDLVANFPQPAAYVLDNTNPLDFILKCEPPPDLDAQPSTFVTLSDSVDSAPTVEVEFAWTKGVVIVKATRFAVTVESEPLS